MQQEPGGADRVPISATVRCTSGWWLIGSVEGRWTLVRAYSIM